MAKDMTLEELAGMIKRGFDDVDKRFDATKQDLQILHSEMNERFQVVADELHTVRADIHDIKTTLGPLVRMVAAQEQEL